MISPSWRAAHMVWATSSVMAAALTADSASLPMVNGPWFCMRTAGDFGYFLSVSTTPSPIASEPMRRNGPTGTSPPNSSPIMVRPHGMFWPVAAHAVA